MFYLLLQLFIYLSQTWRSEWGALGEGGHVSDSDLHVHLKDISLCPGEFRNLLNHNPQFLSCHHYFCQSQARKKG